MKKIKELFMDNYIIFLVYALIGWLYEVLWMWFVVPPKHFINRGVLYGPFLPIYGFGMLILLLLLKRFMSKKHYLGLIPNLVISVSTITTFVFTTIIEYTQPKIYNVLTYLSKYGITLLITNIIAIIVVFILSRKIEKLKKLDTTIVLVFLLIWIITTVIEYVSHFAIDKLSGKMLWDYTYDFLNINKRVNWDASRNFAIGGTFLLYVIQPLINKFIEKLTTNKKIIITAVVGIPMLLDFIFHVILKLI